ncbi:diaminopropionate ammonia-lyase [Bradyrhizobium sp. AZCC 1577]|uniref:diaminopropionate ammonia-lyase n=1 Tax=Bradyrhizobium sp. AZCC 1577 TaxID=3117019 RepID=UPI002FF3C68D
MTAYAHCRNVKRLTPSAEEKAAECARNLGDWSSAVDEIHGWPEYAPQPLHTLDRTASALGIGKLFYKDESQRFGRELGSFKALGAPYTISSLLRDEVVGVTGERPTTAELRTEKYRRITERVTVCVATDGNQGRGLAYGAREFGCRCVIYIHGHVSPRRKEAIERYGAIVIRIDGEYEASVARAREDARMNGWHFVSSTSWDEFRSPLPRYVMNAYMVVIEEALAQLPDPDAVTHVFAQGGVGSIAAAIYLGFRRRCRKLPRLVMVEPVEADCLFQSAANGMPTPSAGSLRTICAGLACREVSPAAWALLEWLGSDFIRIPDSWVVDAMKALADSGGDVPIVCGESAAGGMAVVLKAGHDPDLRQALGLDASSQVVLFGLEGATDPEIFERLVGVAPEAVFERQAKFRGAA